MHKYRLGLFFDGPNHVQALQKANLTMDYAKVLKHMAQSFWVIGARYYSGVSEDEKYKGVRDFLGALNKHGLTVITKPVREYSDGTIKGNLDVEMAVDMLTMSPRLDRILLFSGDGDFTYLVDTLQRTGVYVTVCSHKSFASMDLRNQCNEFLELRDLVNKNA